MLTSLLLTTLALAGSAEDQVRCAELAFSRSAEQRDLAAFESFLDPDARFTGAETLRGAAAVVAGWRPFLEPGGPSIEWAPDTIEVLASGDLALSQGPFRIRMADEAGREIVSTGRFFSVWRRADDGTWKVVFDGGSPARPEESDPFEALDYDRRAVCSSD
jgi:ketosteroid isomerase-like protein